MKIQYKFHLNKRNARSGVGLKEQIQISMQTVGML